MSKLTMQVWLAAGVIWLAVLLCAVLSILNQPFSKKQRFIWLALVIGVPIFGLLAYLPFSIRRDELPTAFLGRPTGRDKKRSAQRQLAAPRLPRA